MFRPKNYVEERLWRKSIPKAELKHGVEYIGECRNATIARWDSHLDKFLYTRKKFGFTFTEEICHPEDDDDFDVFFPLHEIPKPKN